MKTVTINNVTLTEQQIRDAVKELDKPIERIISLELTETEAKLIRTYLANTHMFNTAYSKELNSLKNKLERRGITWMRYALQNNKTPCVDLNFIEGE